MKKPTHEDWRAALDPLMPPDFKDWWQNAESELPEVAATVIESLRAEINRLTERAGEEPTADRRRIETGTAQMDDDWPGVFIRGDNAIHFAMTLDALISEVGRMDLGGSTEIKLAVLEGLKTTLYSCHHATDAQRIKWR